MATEKRIRLECDVCLNSDLLYASTLKEAKQETSDISGAPEYESIEDGRAWRIQWRGNICDAVCPDCVEAELAESDKDK